MLESVTCKCFTVVINDSIIKFSPSKRMSNEKSIEKTLLTKKKSKLLSTL